MKENQKILRCNQLDLEIIESVPILPKIFPDTCLTWTSLSYSHLLAKVKHLPYISPKLDDFEPLEHTLNIINCQKWGETPHENMGFW